MIQLPWTPVRTGLAMCKCTWKMSKVRINYIGWKMLGVKYKYVMSANMLKDL